jgi:hypothetical protein
MLQDPELVNLKHVEKETEDAFFLPGGEDPSLNGINSNSNKLTDITTAPRASTQTI